MESLNNTNKKRTLWNSIFKMQFLFNALNSTKQNKNPNFVIGLVYDPSIWAGIQYTRVFFSSHSNFLKYPNTHTQNSVTAVNFTGSSVLLPQVHFTTSITLSSQTAFLAQRQQFYLTAAKASHASTQPQRKITFSCQLPLILNYFLKTALWCQK